MAVNRDGSPVDFKRRSLDDIVNESGDAEEVAEATDEAAPDPKGEEPEAKTEETEAKAPEETDDATDKAATPAADDTKEDKTVPLAALEDERRKRKEAFERIERLERQVEQSQAAPVEPRPDPLLDPEAAEKWDNEERERSKSEDIKRERESRIAMSYEIMSSMHDDYKEMEDLFADAAEKDPTLAATMANHPLPAKFAYEKGKELQALSEVGNDPAAFREKVEAEIMAKLEAEGRLSGEKPPKPPAPPTLADAPAAVANKDSEKYEGPRPLTEIVSSIGK
jgi:hypothetical protein